MTTELESLLTEWVSRTESRMKQLEEDSRMLRSVALQIKKRIEEIARRVHDLERGEAPSEEIFQYVDALEHKVNGLSMRTNAFIWGTVADMIRRLNKLEAQREEAIEQAIAYKAYENGEDHL